MPRRRKTDYFEVPPDAPAPVSATVSRRCQFSEVDALAIAWHGRYVAFFEEAANELGDRCGLSYEAMYRAGISAPVAQLHIDYHRPLRLNERFTVRASYLWNDAAKLVTQYAVTGADGSCACTGYTVQLFVDAGGEVAIFPPPLLEEFRRRWKNGEFHD